jgi:shikimate dehydrogenase
MSAVMQNAAFRELGLEYKYELLEVKPDDLERVALNLLTDLQVRGGNITIPYKGVIMKYLAEIDQEALRIGAVNVVVNNGGMLKGYNTDGVGALRALEAEYGSLTDARIVVLGAGGASRAICYKLAVNASELVILNRTMNRAATLSTYLSSLPECRAKISAHSLRYKDLSSALNNADILVNTTPVGMYPEIEFSPVESSLLRPGLLVFDSVYNPLLTRLLLDAKAAGAKVLSGVHMLVNQGAAAFEFWVKRKAPETVMMRAVMEALEEKKG